MARNNAAAFPVGSTQSNMVEVCSLPLRAMLTTPAPGTQRVYVTIKQLVAFCSKPPFKCYVAVPPRRARAIGATSMNQQAVSEGRCTSACSQQTEPIRKIVATTSSN